MDVCSGQHDYRSTVQSHDEIVHDEGNCPLCEALEEVKGLESKIEDLKQTIEELKQGE